MSGRAHAFHAQHPLGADHILPMLKAERCPHITPRCLRIRGGDRIDMLALGHMEEGANSTFFVLQLDCHGVGPF